MFKFKDPKKRLTVKGIGIVHAGNLTDGLAVRLLSMNPAYSRFIEKTSKDGKEEKQRKGKGTGKKSGGEKEASESN